MAGKIKTKLSSFIGYEEAIFIYWLSFFEATDRELPEKHIELLRPEQQLIRSVIESQERLNEMNKNAEKYSEEYSVYLEYLKRFVRVEFLGKGQKDIRDDTLWTLAGEKMASELVYVRAAMSLKDWPKHYSDKDRWRAWLFDTAKGSVDHVLESIYDAIYFNRYENGVIEFKVNEVFERYIEVDVDIEFQLALDTILPFLDRYPSDDEVLRIFNLFLNSENKKRKLLAEYIDRQLTISQMSSVKALKNSIAKGRKILAE